MKIGLLIRLFICIAALSGILYLYIDKQNEITKLRLQIPHLKRELEKVHQDCVRIQFEVDQFENPVHLMELARKPEYSHLKHPRLNEILTIEKP